MNPAAAQASATPAPIKDILAPMGYFPYPLWMVALAAFLVLVLLGGLIWWLFLRKKKQKQLTMREEMLQRLEALRPSIESSDPYHFSFMVSDILRTFIEKEYALAATTQTSIEFLAMLQTRAIFGDDQKAALALFLEKADLIKFAHLHATSEDSAALLETAFALVIENKKERGQ
ncbi:MAG: DUF4381 family protein [Chthoniobacterales bacterium]